MLVDHYIGCHNLAGNMADLGVIEPHMAAMDSLEFSIGFHLVYPPVVSMASKANVNVIHLVHPLFLSDLATKVVDPHQAVPVTSSSSYSKDNSIFVNDQLVHQDKVLEEALVPLTKVPGVSVAHLVVSQSVRLVVAQVYLVIYHGLVELVVHQLRNRTLSQLAPATFLGFLVMVCGVVKSDVVSFNSSCHHQEEL